MDVRGRVLERFLRYVKVDTGSDDEAPEKAPSTDRQLVLLNLLKDELSSLGLQEVTLGVGGVLTALLPENGHAAPAAPLIGLIAHVDTYPGTPNAGVRPLVHDPYPGGDLALPAAPDRTIRVSENPGLAAYAGRTVITSDGSTLLGADDKAGVAEIMTALEYLIANPDIPRGPLKVAFTPDEEIGRGTENFPPLEVFGAVAAYTLDGGPAGEVENETFCADSATLTFRGRDVHPGYAKGKMVNAVRAAAHLISLLPGDRLPETTEKRQGYLHPLGIKGDVNVTTVSFIVRDFDMEGLRSLESLLDGLARTTEKAFPGLVVTTELKHSYKNMRYFLERDPRVMDLALAAVRDAGLEPRVEPIRGGTDGSRLSEKGLPTPNLFAGGRNFHSVQEWVPLDDMVKAVEVVVGLVRRWAAVGS
ncbi:MAG: peptidase T [Deltaproteobacteria bacterium]|nr:peptidase T [Deltaproteobacteria bacterium]